MPNLNAIVNYINLNSSLVHTLAPGSIETGNTLIVPATMDNTLEYINRATIDIITNLGFDNVNILDATSTIPLYFTLNYYVLPYTPESYQPNLTGKWILDHLQSAIPPVTSYDTRDPATIRSNVVTPGSSNNIYNVSDFELKNRKVYRENDKLVLNDASELLFYPGYFVIAPFYQTGTGSLGAGVTVSEVFAFKAITAFKLLVKARYSN